jgi:carboxypeptidase Taq
MNAYALLKARFARIATVAEAEAMLTWDAAAVMPAGGSAARADQLAVLAGLEHGLLTDSAVGDLLDQAESSPPNEAWDAENLRLMRLAHRRATALPGKLVEAASRAATQGETVWRVARQENDFAQVAPCLAEIVRLAREQAAALSPALGLSPYDALMDGFQPGIVAAEIEPVFAALLQFIGEVLPLIEARQAANPPPPGRAGPYPADAQETLCRHVAAQAGLDFDHARLDRSAHPFCGGTQTDVRITTRYDEADYASALMGVIHETGHALYERGLPADWARQPVGIAAGMAVHESQSLLLEMQAARSDGFLAWLGPQLHAAFGGDPGSFAPAALIRRNRAVVRSLIRVDADEVTYPAHVALRFRLEQALVAGTLQVMDLPEAWNDGMRQALGVTPINDREGCLQDIHWYCGLFGYFPSYTLGALAAAQIMAAARRALPTVDEQLAAGDFTFLLGFLRAQIHRRGRRYGFNALLEKATGKRLDPTDFQDHVRCRYLG